MSPTVFNRVLRGVTHQESSLAVQSLLLTAAQLIGFSVSFLVPVVLVRALSQTEFGIYKQIFLIWGTAVPVLSLGLPASLYYFVPHDRGDGARYIYQTLAMLTLIAAVAAIAIIAGGAHIAALLREPALLPAIPLVGLIVFLAVPSEVINVLPVVDRRAVLAGLTISGSDFVRAMALVLAAVLWRSVSAVIWAFAAAALLRWVWLAIYLRIRKTGRFSSLPTGRARADLASQLRYALPFAGVVLLNMATGNMHQYYVAAHVSSQEFAIYAVGIMNLPLFSMLIASIADVLLVRATGAFQRGELDEVRQVWHTGLVKLTAIILPLWMLFQLIAHDFIDVLFGSAYLGAVPIFRLFLAIFLIALLTPHIVLRATADTRQLMVASTIGCFVGVAAVFALGNVAVMTGALLGYMVGLATTNLIGTSYILRRLDLSVRHGLPWHGLARTISATALAALPAALALGASSQAVRLMAATSIFMIAYPFIALRLGVIDRSELRMLGHRVVRLWSPDTSTV